MSVCTCGKAATPVYVGLSDAARLLGYSVDTIERRIKAKKLPLYRDGNTRLVKIADVLALPKKVDPNGFAHPVAGGDGS